MSKKPTTRTEKIYGKGDFAKVTHVSAEEAARAVAEEREILRAVERGTKRGATPGLGKK